MKSILLKTAAVLFFAAILYSCIHHDCPPTPDSDSEKRIELKGAAYVKDGGIGSHSPAALNPNDGRHHTLAWTFSGTPGTVRSFMNFDLSEIPEDANIKSAVLYLYSDTITFTVNLCGHSQLSGSNDWSICRVTSAWDELSLSWNTQPSFDMVNSISLPASSDSAQAYVVDVTTLIKDQHQHPDLYYGMMFKLNTEVAYRGIVFCSTQHSAAELRPKLEIEYEENE